MNKHVFFEFRNPHSELSAEDREKVLKLFRRKPYFQDTAHEANPK